MGTQTAIARSIVGVYYIYPPCYAMPCYAMLRSCYAICKLTLAYRSSVALKGTRCYVLGATPLLAIKPLVIFGGATLPLKVRKRLHGRLQRMVKELHNITVLGDKTAKSGGFHDGADQPIFYCNGQFANFLLHPVVQQNFINPGNLAKDTSNTSASNTSIASAFIQSGAIFTRGISTNMVPVSRVAIAPTFINYGNLAKWNNGNPHDWRVFPHRIVGYNPKAEFSHFGRFGNLAENHKIHTTFSFGGGVCFVPEIALGLAQNPLHFSYGCVTKWLTFLNAVTKNLATQYKNTFDDSGNLAKTEQFKKRIRAYSERIGTATRGLTEHSWPLHEWVDNNYSLLDDNPKATVDHNSEARVCHNSLYEQSWHYREIPYSLIRDTIRNFRIGLALGLYGIGRVATWCRVPKLQFYTNSVENHDYKSILPQRKLLAELYRPCRKYR